VRVAYPRRSQDPRRASGHRRQCSCLFNQSKPLAVYPMLVLAGMLLRIIIMRRESTSSYPRPALSIIPATMSTLVVPIQGASVGGNSCDVGLPALATHPSLRRRGRRRYGRFRGWAAVVVVICGASGIVRSLPRAVSFGHIQTFPLCCLALPPAIGALYFDIGVGWSSTDEVGCSAVAR
jgi:hypothetical protein